MRGTQFRQWATKGLNEYILKGFTLDDERLKNGGGRYFRELLQRIRDIRSSERNLYQQVTDIYATAIDYDPKASITREFFATVQNKLHYATHQHTAAEVVYDLRLQLLHLGEIRKKKVVSQCLATERCESKRCWLQSVNLIDVYIVHAYNT